MVHNMVAYLNIVQKSEYCKKSAYGLVYFTLVYTIAVHTIVHENTAVCTIA